jgi:hypothetical protein
MDSTTGILKMIFEYSQIIAQPLTLPIFVIWYLCVYGFLTWWCKMDVTDKFFKNMSDARIKIIQKRDV